MKKHAALLLLILLSALAAAAQSRDDVLRGENGKYRANNDLTYYHLDIRVDPEKRLVSGKNTIRFKMLEAGDRIQIDLYPHLKVEKIMFGNRELKYAREEKSVFIDFPEQLRQGRTFEIDFYYSGTPQTEGRFGGFTFGKDPKGRPWVYTACEGEGSSIWWPSKDQWRDEPESMKISVAVPNSLMDVSNGRFVGKKDLGDGYTRWDYLVHYPINSYNVSVNIAAYKHWADKMGDLPLDFYALPEDVEKAKRQFAQARGMMQAFQHYFGEYPFKKDGYKLIQVPYSGMEHQSAVTYGNKFANGYLERDWTGVGISPRFDFIIIHESGHEWFGNAVSAADRSDMWIHEGWTTYLECLYVEYHYGYQDYLKYTNAYKAKIQNKRPIIAARGVYATPPQDMYFKGALFLHTLRGVVDNDKKWKKLLRDVYQTFKYRNIMTEDMAAFFSKETGMDLTPVFDQYLRHTSIPKLELKLNEGELKYRWRTDETAFAMPVRLRIAGQWQLLKPTTQWQAIKTTAKKSEVDVPTDIYYIEVDKSS